MLQVKFKGTSCEMALKWMPQNTFDENQHLIRLWPGAIRHQAITWPNVDPHLQRPVASELDELSYEIVN